MVLRTPRERRSENILKYVLVWVLWKQTLKQSHMRSVGAGEMLWRDAYKDMRKLGTS